MAVFTYKALTSTGSEQANVAGTITADTASQARQQLRDRGFDARRTDLSVHALKAARA